MILQIYYLNDRENIKIVRVNNLGTNILDIVNDKLTLVGNNSISILNTDLTINKNNYINSVRLQDVLDDNTIIVLDGDNLILDD